MTDGAITGAGGMLPFEFPNHAEVASEPEAVVEVTAAEMAPPEPDPPDADTPPEPKRVSARLQTLLEKVLADLEGKHPDPAFLKHIDTLARAMTAVCALAEKENQLDDASPRPIDDARREALAIRIARFCRQWRLANPPPEPPAPEP
jgi:hypothetical protein